MGALKEIQAMNEIGAHANVVTVRSTVRSPSRITILRCLPAPVSWFGVISRLQLVDAFPVRGQLHVILQRCVADLDTMLKDDGITFTEADIKCIARMMLSGLEHCHSRGFLHRVRLTNCRVCARVVGSLCSENPILSSLGRAGFETGELVV